MFCTGFFLFFEEEAAENINTLSFGEVLLNVTGSAKTQHNRASQNFQYKALNIMGKYLRILKNITDFF